MYKETDIQNGIAIVGMNGQFPGAKNVDDFWKNLCDGHEALREFSRQEVNQGVASHEQGSIPYVRKQVTSGTWVNKGFAMDDMDKFDAEFFGYTPADAELLDPQQRMFLEACWGAMEDAGYVPDAMQSVVGVFGGTGFSRYFINNVFSNREILYSSRDLTAGIGNEPDYLTNRVAFKLNLSGPSVTVQTACSTSLVAIHMACQSLLAGECDMSLAGGAMVSVPNGFGYMYQEGSMNSPDGHIRAFDEKAEGTVFADGGVGVVCLKRLEDAMADNDPIHAVILGSAVSNDGSIKAGYTAPGVDGQVKVINEALSVSGVDPDEITYVEAHGTGTPLGDPIEVTSLSTAYREYTDRKQYCAIGSLKPNVGHLAPTAGVASVIKAALAAKHAVIPPSINFDKPNPRIDFESSPFFVNTELNTWDKEERIAAVSSFGIGGTNAHLILRQPPEREPTSSKKSTRLPYIFPLSAKHDAGIAEYADKLAKWLHTQENINLADIATTLQEARKSCTYRKLLVAKNKDELVAHLTELSHNTRKSVGNMAAPALEKIKSCWMFSGQGSQYIAMGKDLYNSLCVFKESFDQCANLLQRSLNQDIREILFSGSQEQINQTSISQPLLFSFEYALAKQLSAWNLEADAMIGHSLGEYVAATLAEVFTLDDALTLVALRGKLMQSMAPGSMLSVPLSESEVQDYLSDDIALAAINTDKSCVLSGPTVILESIEARLTKSGISSRMLQTSHAFHSNMMLPIIEEFRAAVLAASPQAPSKPYISNVSGTWVTAEQAQDPSYWSSHLLGTVRYADGLRTLINEQTNLFIEVGPGKTLATFARREMAGNKTTRIVELVRHPKEQHNDNEFLFKAIGELWSAGMQLDWQALNPCDGQRISLPSYPFKRDSHWMMPSEDNPSAVAKQEDIADWFATPSWKQARVASMPQYSWDTKNVLFFTQGNELDSVLIDDLRGQGASVILIHEGESFEREDAQSYRLRAGNEEDLGQLAAQLEKAFTGKNAITGIIYNWLFNSDESAQALLEKSFYTPLFLIKQFATDPIFFLSLSTECADPLPGDTLCPVKAAQFGVHLCTGFEYENIVTRNIDLPKDELDQAACLEQIKKEINHLLATEQAQVLAEDKFIALRAGKRWVATYEASRLELSEKIAIDAGAMYVITGGLGGLGLEFARYLAKQGAKNLALLSRSGFPDEKHWDNLEGKKAKQAVLLKEIQGLGCQIETPACDITSDAQVESVVKALSDIAPIKGLIHSAGTAGDGVIQMKTREQTEPVVLPKVLGTLAFDRVLDHEKLDFTVLFSSLFSVIGGVGQVDYSAANSVLDAYARQAQNEGRKVVSINWGGWRDIGMAVDKGMVASSESDETLVAPALPVGKTLNHPYLFSVLHCSEERALYNCWLRVEDHWALQEHKIQQQPTMPGTALIETVRAAFADYQKATQIQIRNLYFFRPLMLEAQDCQQLHIEFTQQGEGYTFTLTLADDSEQRFIQGEIKAVKCEVKTMALADLRSQFTGEEKTFANNEPQILVSDPSFLQLGPRWQVIRKINFGDQAIFGELSLDTGVASDVTSFGLHPSLLDMATGPISGHLLNILSLDLDAEYLPFSYGELNYYAPLTEKIYTHMCFKKESENKDSLFLDIAIYDPEGNCLAEIKDFTLKQVPEDAFAEQLEVEADFLDDSIAPKEGVAAFERIMSAADQAQWVVSTQSLSDLMHDLKASQQQKRDKRNNKIQRTDTSDVVGAKNPLQKLLIEIYETVLGISPIGIHDNYFQLGGDSVLGIQIVSHAKGHGLQLKPGDLFEYQSIAELAASLEPHAQHLFNESEDQALLSMTQQQWSAHATYFVQDVAMDKAVSVALLNEQISTLGEILPLTRSVITRDEEGNAIWSLREALPLTTVNDINARTLDMQPGELFTLFVERDSKESVLRLKFAAHWVLGIDARQWHDIAEWFGHLLATGEALPPPVTGMVADKKLVAASLQKSEAEIAEFYKSAVDVLQPETLFADIKDLTAEIKLPKAMLVAEDLRWSANELVQTVLAGTQPAVFHYSFAQCSGRPLLRSEPVKLPESREPEDCYAFIRDRQASPDQGLGWSVVAEAQAFSIPDLALIDLGEMASDTTLSVGSIPYQNLVAYASRGEDLYIWLQHCQMQQENIDALTLKLQENIRELTHYADKRQLQASDFVDADIANDDLATLLDAFEA